MGPRGVYLAGYLVASAPAAHQLSIDRKEETTMEIAGCSDHDLRKDELDSDKTGHIKESIDAQNTRIERSDKNIKGGKRLLKCSRDKNVDGNIIALKQKTGYAFTLLRSLLLFVVVNFNEEKMYVLEHIIWFEYCDQKGWQ
ncbi:hypothetical protein Hanom_Chr09g00850871 [Helianthus anomalus]